MTAVESSPEAVLFASTSQEFLDKEASIARIRQLHEANSAFDRNWWRRAAELGWTGLLVPEGLGGGSVSGNGVRDLAAVAERMGRTVAPGPLHSVSTVLSGLVDADNRDAHATTIEALISGEAIAAWAVYEAGKPWAPREPTLTATSTASGYRLDGGKDRVEAGADSDMLLVVARCAEGIQQFVVPTDAVGVRVEPEESIDLVKHYARVYFDSVEIDRSAAVGTPGQTPALIERQSHIGLVLQCAEMVGILDTVLGITIQWASDRHTFGRPLASYQALKHRFADMTMWVEACRAITTKAIADVGARSPEADKSASIAKSYVGERAPKVIHGCVQMHGGIGVTWEHDLHLYLRRVALYRGMFGTPEEHNLHLCDLLESSREAND